MLTRYQRKGASSRVRMLQYQPRLDLLGIDCASDALLPDAYLDDLYAGGFRLRSTAGAYANRVARLTRGIHANALWLEKEALPWLPWPLERVLLPGKIPLVVDFDDAVFHRYDLHRSPVVRGLLGRKLDRLMASATLVTAGNAYLADRARTAGARRVEIVPTVVDLDTYVERPAPSAEAAPVIGWIGTPSTWKEYMRPILPLLTRTAAAAGARISVVGAGPDAEGLPAVEAHPWTEETEVAAIGKMDIGIMPLTDTPWARGKCGYKLIQYMACGLPVVASPVGVNREIVEHGVNGFLVSTDAEWEEAIAALLADPELRMRMGRAGRRRVEERYSLQVWAPKVAEILKQAAGGRAAG